MPPILQDLRTTLRSFLKSRGWTAAAVLCLAAGVGASTAIFSLVDAAVLRPLPFRDADRLVAITEVHHHTPGPAGICTATVEAVESSGILAQIAAYDDFSANLAARGGPERVSAGLATPGFFELLGVRPAVGRSFTREDVRVADARVVVLSARLLQGRFGGDPGLLGRALSLDRGQYVVVGVMPSGFELPLGAELWEPLSFLFPDPAMRFWRSLNGVGRLAPGKSLRQTQAELDVLSERLARLYPASHADWTLRIRPLHDELVGDTRSLALALMAGAALVLAITSANVMSLLLARGVAQGRTLAIQSALGAGRARLVRQPLLASLLLSLAGGGGGLLLAAALLRPLARLLPSALPALLPVTLNLRALAFGLLVSLVTGALASLVPSLRAERPDLQTLLQNASRGSSARGESRLQSLLVVAEIASTLALLVATGLLLLSQRALLRESPGFRTDGLLTLRLGLPESAYPDPPQQAAFFHRLVEAVRVLPGVRAAGFTSALPLHDREHDMKDLLSVEGQPPARPGAAELVHLRLISPGYLEVMGIRLLAGRSFTARDDAQAPRVVLVTPALARRAWPGQSPLGRRIKGGPYDSKEPWLTVVGVVADIKEGSLREPPPPLWYQPFAQSPFSFATLVIRTDRPPLALVPQVRRAVWAIDREQPIFRVATMAEVLKSASAPGRASALLLGLFSLLGVTLAVLGLHGLISYMVSHRQHEFGIRMAMGARASDILGDVLRRGVVLTLLGLGLGFAAALASTRMLSSLIYGVSPLDPRVLLLAGLLLFAVALVASYLPARQASRVDPARAFRDS